MKPIIIALLAALLLSATADAQIWIMSPGGGGPTPTGAGGHGGGGGGGCTGTIDLSTGCVQPMLGGL